MYRLKRILFDSYDLEFYYSGDNPPRVVSVYKFTDDEDLYLFATTARRNWSEDYHENNQSQFYISDHDIQEIEPIDISNDPPIITNYGKTPSDKESS